MGARLGYIRLVTSLAGFVVGNHILRIVAVRWLGRLLHSTQIQISADQTSLQSAVFQATDTLHCSFHFAKIHQLQHSLKPVSLCPAHLVICCIWCRCDILLGLSDFAVIAVLPLHEASVLQEFSCYGKLWFLHNSMLNFQCSPRGSFCHCFQSLNYVMLPIDTSGACFIKQVYQISQVYLVSLTYCQLIWFKISRTNWNKPGLFGKLVLWNGPL